MGSRSLATTGLLLTLNLVFFTLVTSSTTPKACPPSPPPPCPPPSPPPPKSCPPPKAALPSPPTPSTKPATPPSPTPPSQATCPTDTLKLGVCANVLNGLIPIVIGSPSNTPCCSLLGGLTDLDAAVCLCTAIKANLLGIQLNIPISLSLLLNYCDKKLPSGFDCS